MLQHPVSLQVICSCQILFFGATKYVMRQRSQFTRLCSKISTQACADTNSTWGIQHVLSPEIIKVTFAQELATKAQKGE